ncbi:MAG TPA: DegV family protein [Clostridia bacterium]|jgi:DegV family protein with EDD domain|nr:DegV family protein [Clostridia bacterium]
MIKLFFDTDSELTFELAKKVGIENNVIRFPYTLDGEIYYADLGQTYDPSWFFGKVRAGSIPTTSALNGEEFKEYFEPEFKNGNEVLYVSFGTNFSATFSMMDQAINELKIKYPNLKFTRYDTKAISLGTGILVLQAAKLLNKGKTTQQIIKKLDEIAPFVHMEFVVDDLLFLKRGGRLTTGKAIMGTILQLKPIIKLTEAGKLEPFQSVQGKAKARQIIVDNAIQNADGNADSPVFILHGDCLEEVSRYTSLIKNKRPDLDVVQLDIGPVIGTHCGPGTIGLCYVAKNKKPQGKY